MFVLKRQPQTVATAPRAHRRLSPVVALLACGLTLATAACSSSVPSPTVAGSNSQGDIPEPPLGPIPKITSSQQVTFPLDAYRPSVDQSVAIMLQDEALINQCAADAGSPDRLKMRKATQQGDVPVEASDLRAKIVAERASLVQYFPYWTMFVNDPASVTSYVETYTSLDPISSIETNLGDSEVLQRCWDAVSAITPNGTALSGDTSDILGDGGPSYGSDDSRVDAAEQEWSACMKSKGFNYATPFKIQDDSSISQPLNPDALARLRAVAVADMACKKSTNLVGVGVAVASAYEQRYIDSHRDALRAYEASVTDYLAGRVAAPTPATPDGTATK